MNMKNANVEFVSFDAKDVIATSGSTTAYFQLNASLVDGLLSGYTYLYDGDWDDAQGVPYKLELYDDNQNQLVYGGDGKYFVLTNESWFEGSFSDDKYVHIHNVSRFDNKPKSGESYDTLVGIIGWLTTNGAQ